MPKSRSILAPRSTARPEPVDMCMVPTGRWFGCHAGPGLEDITMNTPKMDPAGHAVSSPRGASDSLVDHVAQHSCAALLTARDAGEPTARSTATFPSLQALAKPQSPRVAIKAKGRILFIDLGDVVAVQAQANYVLFHRSSGSYLLHESISVIEEKLEPYGFIRIHRSVLVNPSCVEEMKPHPSGSYGLRIKGGKEYTVTRTYKKNLSALAELWIGTGTVVSD